MHRLIFENPAPLFLVLCLAAFYAFGRMHRLSGSRLRLFAGFFGGAAAAIFGVIALLNVIRGGLLWHDEANILSITATFLRGSPVYHSPARPEYYSLFYGPATYLIYAPFLEGLHDPLFWMKMAVTIADLLALVFLFLTFRVWVPVAESIALLSSGIVLLLAYPDELLGVRGDPWLLLCMCLATYAVVRGNDRWANADAVLAGLACGLAIDLKITVIPVACLLLAVLYHRRGTKAGLLGALACVAVGAGVFLTPHISLLHYLEWLRLSSRQRFLRSGCLAGIIASCLLLLPSALLRFSTRTKAGRRRGEWTVLTLGAVALAVCIASGSKDSAGPWHLWPMMPILLAGAAYEMRPSTERVSSTQVGDGPADLPEQQATVRRKAMLTAALGVAGAFSALYFARKDVLILRPLLAASWKANASVADASLRALLSQPHARNFSMGYGGNLNDYRTDLRYELPLAGQDYFFDENEVVEGIKERLPVPADVQQRILGCDDIWLIPHGEAPFSALRSTILPPSPELFIFPDSLREGFPATHHITHTGDVYDQWGCTSDR